MQAGTITAIVTAALRGAAVGSLAALLGAITLAGLEQSVSGEPPLGSFVAAVEGVLAPDAAPTAVGDDSQIELAARFEPDDLP